MLELTPTQCSQISKKGLGEGFMGCLDLVSLIALYPTFLHVCLVKLSHMRCPATLAIAIFVGPNVMTNVAFQGLIMKLAGKFYGKFGFRACYPFVAERIWGKAVLKLEGLKKGRSMQPKGRIMPLKKADQFPEWVYHWSVVLIIRKVFYAKTASKPD